LSPLPASLIGITLSILPYFLLKLPKNSTPSKMTRGIFVSIIVATTALQLCILYFVDPHTIQLDRWSAIHYFWDAVFHGNYPYSIETHLNIGNTPSPLPIWQLVMLPFYLFGDVGLIQIFVFITLTLFVIKSKKVTNKSIILMFFILLSPAYWYEIYTRSDLLSCMIVSIPVLSLIHKMSYHLNTGKGLLLTAILLGGLMATRAVLIIPATIVMAHIIVTHRNKILLLPALASLFFAATLLPFYLWDSDLFLSYNPLVLHANKSVPGLIPIALVIAFIIGIRNRTFSSQMFWAGIIIFSVTLVKMGSLLLQYSPIEIIKEDLFDITYLSMAAPFLYCGAFIPTKPIINHSGTKV